jgi:hypothetical protein
MEQKQVQTSALYFKQPSKTNNIPSLKVHNKAVLECFSNNDHDLQWSGTMQSGIFVTVYILCFRRTDADQKHSQDCKNNLYPIFLPSYGATAQIGPWPPLLRLLNHSQLYTHGRNRLDEWSARHRGLYLHRTTQHIYTRDKDPCPQLD